MDKSYGKKNGTQQIKKFYVVAYDENIIEKRKQAYGTQYNNRIIIK